jgi:dipeptidyl aminopeptidase/acylaminoacyl peptidase
MSRSVQFLAVLGCALSLFAHDAFAERPYIVGGKNDPAQRSTQDEDKGEQLLRVELLRSYRYDPRYAAARVNVAPGGQAVSALGRLSQSGPVAWDLGSGQRRQLPRIERTARQLAFDFEMTRLAAATVEGSAGEGGVDLYDLDTGKLLRRLKGGREAHDLAFSPDGNVIVAATRAGVFAWDLREQRSNPSLLTGEDSDSVLFSSADELLIAGQSGGLLQVYSFSKGRVVERPSGPGGGASAWSPDGRYLALARRTGIRILDLETGQSQEIPSGQEIVSVDWGASGHVIAAGTAGGEILVYLVDGVAGARTEGETSLKTGRRETGPATAQSDSRRLPARQAAAGGRVAVPQREEKLTIEASYQVLILKRFDADPREGKDLERRLRGRGTKLAGCWKKELRQGKTATGRLEVTMDVTPDGEGRGLSEVLENSLKNDRLTDCIEDKLRGALFPAGLDDLNIHLTIELEAVVAP